MQTSSAAGRPDTNLGDKERLVSALAGSLLLYGTAKKHTLNTLLLLGGGYLIYRAVTGHCAVSQAISRRSSVAGGDLKVRCQMVVNRPRPEVYAFWRRLENLPLFMRHLDHVDELDARTSVWRLRMPGGMEDIRWEARIVRDEKDVEFSWNSIPGAAIRNTGKINFSDTPAKGTRIDVMLVYGIPSGAIGERMAGLLSPGFRSKVEQDVEHFREFSEINTGHILMDL